MSILRDLDPKTSRVDGPVEGNKNLRYVGWSALVLVVLALLWGIANFYDGGAVLKPAVQAVPSTGLNASPAVRNGAGQGGQPIESKVIGGQAAAGEVAPSAAVILGSAPAVATPAPAKAEPVSPAPVAELAVRKEDMAVSAASAKPKLTGTSESAPEKDHAAANAAKKPAPAVAEKSKVSKGNEGRPGGSEKRSADRDIEIITAIVK